MTAPDVVDSARERWLTPAFVGDDPSQEGGLLAHAFRIGERWLLIPTDLEAEVSPKLSCARLPYTKPWCLGLANHRGELVPAYHLGRLLDEDASAPGPYLLILGRRGMRAALCIDAITVVTFPGDATSVALPPLPNLPDRLACQGLAANGVNYTKLDLAGLLDGLARQAGVL